MTSTPAGPPHHTGRCGPPRLLGVQWWTPPRSPGGRFQSTRPTAGAAWPQTSGLGPARRSRSRGHGGGSEEFSGPQEPLTEHALPVGDHTMGPRRRGGKPLGICTRSRERLEGLPDRGGHLPLCRRICQGEALVPVEIRTEHPSEEARVLVLGLGPPKRRQLHESAMSFP